MAELIGDHEESSRLWRDLHRDRCDFAVLSAATIAAIVRRFGDVKDLRDISRFIAKRNALVSAAIRMAPRECEAMVRAALGEVHLLDAVPPSVMRELGWEILSAVVGDLQMSATDIEDLLLGAEWTARTAKCLFGLSSLRTDGEDPAEAWQLPHQRRKLI